MLYANFGWSELNIFDEIENVHCLQRQHMIRKNLYLSICSGDINTYFGWCGNAYHHYNSLSIVDIQNL